jgi:hypothetical protein
MMIALAIVVLTGATWAGNGNESRNASVNSGHSGSSGTEIGWNGWGVRVGVASDADQVVGGAQFNLGEFVDNLRFQPDVELGAGDDVTTLYGTAPVYYRFQTSSTMTPYAGGGLAMGFVDYDNPVTGSGETSFEVGARATGGLEWGRGDGQAFFVEASLGFGDVHDFQVVGAWQF